LAFNERAKEWVTLGQQPNDFIKKNGKANPYQTSKLVLTAVMSMNATNQAGYLPNHAVYKTLLNSLNFLACLGVKDST